MKIIYSASFKKRYKKIPAEVIARVGYKIDLFKEFPFHLALKTHKLHGKMKNFWVFSIDYRYRIIFKFENDQLVKFEDIGNHDMYE